MAQPFISLENVSKHYSEDSAAVFSIIDLVIKKMILLPLLVKVEISGFNSKGTKIKITMENNSQIIIYQTEDGNTKIETRLEDETVWLTQTQLAELFLKSRVTITEHIGNIFKECELQEDSVSRKFRLTAPDGKSYDTAFYNLDVIISVGYRVKSQRGSRNYLKTK